MKLLLIALTLSLAAFPALAAKRNVASAQKCEVTTGQVATVLVNSTEQLAELKKNYLNQSRMEPSCRKIEEGVTEFTFEFTTCGNCLPKSAKLTVVQDIRPSHVDGPIKYDHTLIYAKDNGGGGR